MKNIIKTFLIAFIAVGIFSCEDNEKSPLPATIDGSFVTIEFDNLILDVTDLDNTAITGVLRAPVPNVASYELQVARSTGGVLSDYVTVYTTDTFPADFSINLEDLSGALGLEVADFGAGDRFDFQATSISTDGSVTEFSLLNPDLHNVLGDNLDKYTIHLIENGIQEKRPYKIQHLISYFDINTYRNNYIDLKDKNDIELVQHYYEYGIKEERVYNKKMV